MSKKDETHEARKRVREYRQQPVTYTLYSFLDGLMDGTHFLGWFNESSPFSGRVSWMQPHFWAIFVDGSPCVGEFTDQTRSLDDFHEWNLLSGRVPFMEPVFWASFMYVTPSLGKHTVWNPIFGQVSSMEPHFRASIIGGT